MSTPGNGKEIRVIHNTQDMSTTVQTPGMERRPGIDTQTVGASKIWLGHVTAVPNMMGPPHHHGEAETAAFVIKGRVRVYYGEDFKEVIEAGPGDYLFVPAHIPHIEGNPYDEPYEAIVCRSPDNIVINLDS